MKTTLLTSVIFLLALPILAFASDNDKHRFDMFMRYGTLMGISDTFDHTTHPDDWFLDGDYAGSTEMKDLYYLSLGGRHSWKTNPFIFYLEYGASINLHDDVDKNVNDGRPDSNAAFIYSTARWGGFVGGGIVYDIPGTKFFVGADGQVNVWLVEHGWDRFGRHEADERKLEFYPTVGPKIGYHIAKDFDIEFSAQFGGDIQVYFLNCVYKF